MRSASCLTTLRGAAILGVLLLSACGGGGSSSGAGSNGTTAPTGTVSVTLVGVPATVTPGASLTVSAQVQGTTSTAVTWTVDNIANGNASTGTISGSGDTVTYIAPAVEGNHMLGATSVLDPTKSAKVKVTIQNPSKISSISVAPATWTLSVGAQEQFAATVSGTGNYNPGVTWSTQRGSITAAGLYTAPPSGGSDVVTATSVQDTSKTASASVTVTVPSSISSVAVNPATLALSTSAQSQFTATVTGTGSFSSGINWSAQRGSITSAGLYTAPATSGTDVVTATSAQDTSKSASAAATVQAPAAVSVSLTPSGSLNLNVSGSTSFTATVSGSTNTAVTWTVDGITGGNTTVGALSGSGNTVTYTAPAAAGSHIIKATSVADATKFASTTVTVQTVAVPTGFVVAPNGVLGNPGTLAAPTTLEGARTLLQSASRANPGTLRVLLRGGIYPRSATFTLGSTDSGSAANPIEYAAYPNESPRLVGGVSVSAASAHLVDGTDPNWSRLDPAARPQIYVIDLTAYKSSLGTLASRSESGGSLNQSMEVFVDGAPLTLARYPKAVDVGAVNIAPHATIHVSGTLSPDVTGDYAYKGLDSLGRPYYQLAKGGDLWSIAASATGPEWRLSNRKDLGGTGSSASWGVWDTMAGPAGAFAPLSGASGTAFLAPADGSSPVPGFLLIRGTNGTTQITAPDSRMSRWRASEAMYYGLGYYSWSGSHSPITSMDPTTGSLVLSGTPTFGLLTGQPFFIYNLLEELTAPGECFIDRANARLYLRPIGDVPPTEILLSTLKTPILQMQNCQQVTWQGIAFEAAQDNLVSVTNGQSVAFKNCQFRNAGGNGILLGGSSNLVEACDFRQLGKGGVWVWGGDRISLTPSGTLIENSEFQYFGRLFWTYQPAVKIRSFNDSYYNPDCMGITVQHNEIHHSPQVSILFSGNGNTIRYNHIHDVAQWTNDAAAIYFPGREWGTQGNLVQFNLIRNCGGPLGIWVSGIYIDGVGSGVNVEGNILYHAGALCAIQHNGGRDVQTQYNISYGHWYGLDVTNCAFSFVNNTVGSSWDLLGKLLYLNYQSATWTAAYPNVAKIPNTWSQLPGTHWMEPEGSVCYGNLQFGSSPDVYRQSNYARSLAPPVSWFSQVGGNLSQVDPLFTDPAKLDFSLQPGSPMFNVPGFPGIDVTKIGIQK